MILTKTHYQHYPVRRPTSGSPDHLSEYHLRGTSKTLVKSKTSTTSYFSPLILLLPFPPPPLAFLPSSSSPRSTPLSLNPFPIPLPPFTSFFYSHPLFPSLLLVHFSFIYPPPPPRHSRNRGCIKRTNFPVFMTWSPL